MAWKVRKKDPEHVTKNVNICSVTNLGRQVHFHWDVGWPIAHSEDVYGQFDVARNILALHVLQKKPTTDTLRPDGKTIRRHSCVQ